MQRIKHDRAETVRHYDITSILRFLNEKQNVQKETLFPAENSVRCPTLIFGEDRFCVDSVTANCVKSSHKVSVENEVLRI